MLKIRLIQQSQDRESIIDRSMDPKKTYLVSDLPRKFELQRRLFESYEGLSDEQVLRVSEFWMLLHRRLYPQHRLVSRDFLKLAIGQFFEENNLSQVIHSRSDAHIMDWIEYFHPLFFHPETEALLQEEVALSKDANLATWWKISKTFFLSCLDQGWVNSHWLSSLIQQKSDSELSQVWTRSIVFDLGGQVSQQEIDLIERLGRLWEVELILPDAKFLAQFPAKQRLIQNLVHRYPNSLIKEPTPFPGSDAFSESTGTLRVHRMPNPLAEAKAVVALVRQRLEENSGALSLSQIAILSPQIENYWPLLQSHFAVEGIPVMKAKVSRLSTLLPIHQWISRLRLSASQIDFANMETFLGSTNWLWRSEKLQGLFRNIIDAEDLKREPELESVMRTALEKQKAKAKMSLNEFLMAALGVWQADRADEEVDYLMQGLHRLVDTTPSQVGGLRAVEFSFSRWTQYLEMVLAQVEIPVIEAAPEGILVGNLSFGELSSARYKIYLGLQDSVFQQERVLFPGASRLQAVMAQHGFYLAHPEEVDSDFSLRWQIQSAKAEVILLSADAGWEGQAEMPHPLLIELGVTPTEELFSRWDEIQAAHQVSLSADRNVAIAGGLSRQDFRLSASSVDRFISCPFVFSAGKDFRLLDEPDQDLDPDRRSQGSLIHGFLESLATQSGFPSQIKMSDEEWLTFVDGVQLRLGANAWDPALWSSLRKKLIRLGKRFLAAETLRLGQPQVWSVFATEKKVQAFFNRETLNWQSTKIAEGSSAKISEFHASLDRVDQHEGGGYWVSDYKGSVQKSSIVKNWLEEGQLQIGIYATMIEDLREEFPSATDDAIRGATYYSYHTMKNRSGFLIDEFPKKFARNEWSQLSQKLRTTLRDTIEQIENGVYLPAPKDEAKCGSCNWKGVCHASHLS